MAGNRAAKSFGDNLIKGTACCDAEKTAAVEFAFVDEKIFLLCAVEDFHEEAGVVFVVGRDIAVAEAECGKEGL